MKACLIYYGRHSSNNGFKTSKTIPMATSEHFTTGDTIRTFTRKIKYLMRNYNGPRSVSNGLILKDGAHPVVKYLPWKYKIWILHQSKGAEYEGEGPVIKVVGVVPLIWCIMDIIVRLSDGYFHCPSKFGRSVPTDDIDSRHERLQEREREIRMYCSYTRNCVIMEDLSILIKE